MPTEFPRPRSIARQAIALAVVLGTTVIAPQGFAADEQDTPNGAAVTVLKATRSCFSATVEVTGILIPKNETAVRPERPGLKVAEIMVEPGQSVTAGQVLARLNRPEGGSTQVHSPVAGLVSNSSAEVGAIASGKGEALFNIITGNEFDLVGQVPTTDLAKLAGDQPAKVKAVGAGDIDGKVRLVAPTIEPNSQLGQVFISVDPSRHLLVNASGRAIIKTGESCGIAVPLTAILYGSAGTVVQVVRHQRVETRHVEVGLLSGGQVEVREGLSEGDVVVARAGALLREGDPVRPVAAEASAK
ncbi:Secretion protein HlyD [Nitrobacter hamburgensis X14]|uniref:Secretion protein HlyD n=1 Tax=Nitrobacter hamburgensis (strain DSM 10229 / NCIMB 13809 / X14) TaxID=323097 RepID=Q1QHG4_NITHX|nr:HlyD family efflux transporter periplasmic adaptor subunit [Nitrobacter hamburgensis]ABE64333.1 Secretion protein HlyD [Nitrobacter hamburgensis X14]